MNEISIHALLAESDSDLLIVTVALDDFYPRSPCGERQDTVSTPNRPEEFLSTLSLRRATWPGLLARPFFLISIHALLAESDSNESGEDTNNGRFLSTLSLRRATGR